MAKYIILESSPYEGYGEPLTSFNDIKESVVYIENFKKNPLRYSPCTFDIFDTDTLELVQRIEISDPY